MANEFKPIKANDDDVISFNDHTYKFGKFDQALRQSLNKEVANQILREIRNRQIKIIKDNHTFINGSLFTEGIECEMISTEKKGWTKGKLRLKVTLEFCSDESEIKEPPSPLDEIRKSLQN